MSNPRGLARLFKSLLSAPTTRSALLYGLMGIGFSGAHLLLAKFLPIAEYAVITLTLAILNLAKQFGPVGAQGVVLRQQLPPHRSMLIRVIVSAAIFGVVVAVAAAAVYGLDTSLVLLIAAGSVAGSSTVVAATYLQSKLKLGRGIILGQCGNIFTLLAAVTIILVDLKSAAVAIGVVVLGYAGVAFWSWSRLLGGRAGDSTTQDYSWREALGFLLVSGAVPFLAQSERLLIPQLLSLEDLATYGVLAAIIISPYRTLQMGAAFATLPRLRAADSIHEQRLLLKKEALILLVLVLAGALLLAWLTPLLIKLIYQDKFAIDDGLILAAIGVGAIRSFCGLAKGAALALCPTEQLSSMGYLIWLCPAIAVAGAAFGAEWGLTGLVLGIGSGWVAMLLVYAVLAAPQLRLRPVESG